MVALVTQQSKAPSSSADPDTDRSTATSLSSFEFLKTVLDGSSRVVFRVRDGFITVRQIPAPNDHLLTLQWDPKRQRVEYGHISFMVEANERPSMISGQYGNPHSFEVVIGALKTDAVEVERKSKSADN